MKPSSDMVTCQTTAAIALLSLSRARSGVVRLSRLSSAHRLLDELCDLDFVGLFQLLDRERDWPRGAVIEVGAVVEGEHRVPLLELRRVAEEADDFAFLVGVRGHPVPRLGRELWGGLLDDFVNPLADRAILRRHRGERIAHGGFPVRGRLQFLGARSHRGLLLGRESFFPSAALGGLLLALLCTWAHRAPFTCWTTASSRTC